MTRVATTFGVLLAVALSGCADRAVESVPPGEVRDSAGVTIVDNGELDLERELLASPVPSVEIGVTDGPEELQLFQVMEAKRLADGGFAVANGGTRELKIFNSDGTHRATSGGAGQGPSEFGYPVAVRILRGDTILVHDRYDRVYFTSDGEYIERETTGRQALSDLTTRIGGNSEGGQWLADGTFFAPIYQWEQNPPVAGPLFRPAMTFVRVSHDLSTVDTLGEFGGILQQFVDIGEDRPSATVPPFASNTSWGLGPSDGTIVAADNAVPQVQFFAADGGHLVARWSASRESVAAGEVEEWKDLQRSAPWAQRRLPQRERAWAAMDLPVSKPYYGRASTGSDGTVWLGPAETDGKGWVALGPDGRFVGVAGLSSRFVPMDSGPGWLLGLYRDEQDVEFLRLYELIAG